MKFSIFAKLLFFPFLLTACAGGPPPPYRYIDSQQNVEHLEQSVVSLFRRTNSGIEGPSCTAFFVSSTVLATAKHCVEAPTEQTIEIMRGLQITVPIENPEPTVGRVIPFLDRNGFNVWVANGDPTQMLVYEASVVEFSDTLDLAYLEVPERYVSQHWLPISNRLPRIGERVYTLGMPASQPWILGEGMVSSIRVTFSGQRSIIHRASIAPGASGSPVVDNLGRVVGVNIALVEEAPFLSVAEPSTYLHELLGNHIR